MTEQKGVIQPPEKPPDLSTEEKAAALRNAAAHRPRQQLYLKITSHCPIESDAVATFLSAVDALEAACETAKLEAKLDVEVTPPSEATEKHAAARRAKAEAKAKHEAEVKAKLEADAKAAALKPH